MQWTTHNRYVDHNTGEILDPQQIKKGKFIIRAKEIKHEIINSYTGKKTITNLCEPNRQLQLNL